MILSMEPTGAGPPEVERIRSQHDLPDGDTKARDDWMELHGGGYAFAWLVDLPEDRSYWTLFFLDPEWRQVFLAFIEKGDREWCGEEFPEAHLTCCLAPGHECKHIGQSDESRRAVGDLLAYSVNISRMAG